MQAEQQTKNAYQQWRDASSHEDHVRNVYRTMLNLERATSLSSPLFWLRTQARHEIRIMYDAAMQQTDAAMARYQRSQQQTSEAA